MMIVKNEDIGLKELEEKMHRKILVSEGSLMLVEVYFKKGGEGPLHSHPHEQISYVVKGSFEVTVGEEKSILSKGDSFYAEPDVEHGLVALEDAVIIDVFTPVREDFLED